MLSVAQLLLFVGGACCKWDVTAMPMRLPSVPAAAGGSVDACYTWGDHVTQCAGQSQDTVDAKLELAPPRRQRKGRAHEAAGACVFDHAAHLITHFTSWWAGGCDSVYESARMHVCVCNICNVRMHVHASVQTSSQDCHQYRACTYAWTHWDLNPGPSACEADVIPLHHVPN